MATFTARVVQESDGSWVAAAVELPHCWSRGRTQDEALAKLRDEVRYRIEYCPCTGVADDFVQIVPQEKIAALPPRRAPALLSGIAGCPAPRERDTALRPRDPAPALPQQAARPGWKRWDD